MGAEALKQALADCEINFDRRVLVTDLLQKYRLPYKEVNDVLTSYIEKNKGTKFEKRFLVSGDEEETNNEIYTIVKGESKVEECLCKLKNAESALYSVEVAGGAKSPADIFKPMTWCPSQLDNIAVRAPLKWGGSSNVDIKPLVKEEVKKKKGFDFGAKKPTATITTDKQVKETEKDIKQTPPEKKKTVPEKTKSSPETKKSSPENEKPSTAKPINKKGIASFFGAQSNAAKSESKKSRSVVKPPTPKKMGDFFKKSEKPAASTSKAAKEEIGVNTSHQLFSDEENEMEVIKEESHTVVEVDTSDDEAQLEALRRQCMEKEAEAETSSASTKKRRRIIDSDDDDDNNEPVVKHEKKEEEKGNDSDPDDDTEKSETYLDDEGYLVTIKSKKTAKTKKQTVWPKTPEKTPPVQQTNKKSPKATPKQTSKTKQGNIMSFFSKK